MAERDRILAKKDRGDERVRVEVSASPSTGEFETISEEALRLAGWTEDPGEGKAVLLRDGREVFNPIPMAPPVGYTPQPTLMEMLDQMVQRHLAVLHGDTVIDDTAEEADDFEIEDEIPDPFSVYEVTDLIPESPALPKAAPVSETPPVVEPSVTLAPANETKTPPGGA